MVSRYDLMKAGVSTDPMTAEVYPDTLSVNYNKFKYYQPPYQVSPNDQLLHAPYVFTYSYYQTSAYDDIVLNINGVSHITNIYNYDILKFPVLSDIVTFMKK